MKNGKRMDPHYKAQHTYCGLPYLFKYYNHVIYYKHETIADDTLKFLELINKKEYFYHWGSNHDETMFKGSKAHITYNNSDNIEFYKRYYTADLAMMGLHAFDSDYKLFNLSIPAWVSSLD